MRERIGLDRGIKNDTKTILFNDNNFYIHAKNSKTSNTIIRQLYYPYRHWIEKVNKKVVINIAVNLAKEFIDDKQAKFINAILDGGVLSVR